MWTKNKKNRKKTENNNWVKAINYKLIKYTATLLHNFNATVANYVHINLCTQRKNKKNVYKYI